LYYYFRTPCNRDLQYSGYEFKGRETVYGGKTRKLAYLPGKYFPGNRKPDTKAAGGFCGGMVGKVQ